MTGEAKRRGTPEARESMAIAQQEIKRREREQYLRDNPPPPISRESMSILPLLYGLPMMMGKNTSKYRIKAMTNSETKERGSRCI